jgi:hypothetical protein
MRHAFALRQAAAGVGTSSSLRLAVREGFRKSSILLVAAGGTLTAAACSPVPVPDTALLEPQPAPKCEARRQQDGTTGEASGDAGAQARLDYERQCYRHAELIVRNRLHKLQASVQKTVKAIKEPEHRAGRPHPDNY